MINNIIFSLNRPQQLRLLLESISRNAPNIFNVNIIYTYSDEQFKLGYEKLQQENILPNINWVKQSDNFKQDVITLLNNPNYEYSCFGVDDDVFYGKVDEQDIIEAMGDENVFCFSARLGENITHCYTMRCDNRLYGQTYNEKGNVIKFDWKKHFFDFNYPLGTDFHIFRTKEILKLSTKITFKTPNELEGSLYQFFGTNYPKNMMCSYKTSVLVGVPVNIVNNTHPNLNGQKFPVSIKDLNDKYLRGEVIDYDKLDFSSVIGCHQEILYQFKKL